MSRGQYQPVPLVWLVVAAVMVVFFVYQVANADDGHGHDHHDGEAVNVGGDSSRAIGVGGADYDIGRGSCKFHVGGLTVAIARTDEFCEGMEMIRAGLVDAGILHLCLQSKVGKNYTTLQDCQDGMAVYVPSISPEVPIVKIEDYDDEKYEAQQTYLGELESRMDKLDTGQQEIRQIAEQRVYEDGAERRARARAARDEAMKDNQ